MSHIHIFRLRTQSTSDDDWNMEFGDDVRQAVSGWNEREQDGSCMKIQKGREKQNCEMWIEHNDRSSQVSPQSAVTWNIHYGMEKFLKLSRESEREGLFWILACFISMWFHVVCWGKKIRRFSMALNLAQQVVTRTEIISEKSDGLGAGAELRKIHIHFKNGAHNNASNESNVKCAESSSSSKTSIIIY